MHALPSQTLRAAQPRHYANGFGSFAKGSGCCANGFGCCVCICPNGMGGCMPIGGMPIFGCPIADCPIGCCIIGCCTIGRPPIGCCIMGCCPIGGALIIDPCACGGEAPNGAGGSIEGMLGLVPNGALPAFTAGVEPKLLNGSLPPKGIGAKPGLALDGAKGSAAAAGWVGGGGIGIAADGAKGSAADGAKGSATAAGCVGGLGLTGGAARDMSSSVADGGRTGGADMSRRLTEGFRACPGRAAAGWEG